MKRAYKVVDVFTAAPLLGNPVAVVLDAEGLDTVAMQAIAGWTNLSETTFLLPPESAGADYKLRIFTPRSELPFAGHPTLGSAHAALEAGRVAPRGGRLVQECGVGLVNLDVAGDGAARLITLALPPPKLTPLDPEDIEELEAVLGVPVDREASPTIVNVGAIWIVARVSSAEQVLSVQPDFARSAALERRLGVTGVTIFGPHQEGEAAIEVRSFAPSVGANEDPVCGSGNGSVAVFQHAHGLLSPQGENRYVAARGQCVGRAGCITVHIASDGAVQIGGQCVTTVAGTLTA
jgi:PhzF family phenazine biosynthesis protein